MVRPWGKARPDSQPDASEYAELLSDEEAKGDRDRKGLGQPEIAQLDTSARQPEQGHDSKHHPRVDRMFQPLEW